MARVLPHSSLTITDIIRSINFPKPKSRSDSECVVPSYRTIRASTVHDPTASYWPEPLYCRTWDGMGIAWHGPRILTLARQCGAGAYASARRRTYTTRKSKLYLPTPRMLFCLSNNPIAEVQYHNKFSQETRIS